MSSIEEYGANFCFPVKDLESERVKLTPFLPSKHAKAFYAIPRPSYDYLPFGPFDIVQDFISSFLENRIHADPGCVLFAVYDKTKASETGHPDGALAGAMGFCNASAPNLAVEIAFVLISPKFQRTHVTSNAIGLLLHYALDLPEAGGLGLRRVVWAASPLNEPSIKAAERMGFKREGYLRWVYVMPEVKQIGNGLKRRAGDPKAHLLGRDTVILSLCWDDWEDGAGRHVDEVMARTV
ncbi:acyl-CoA N-acyltransferase [Lyophyllum atratum]|nr:acyl-CoA N-acyltransferase [Lyophyllum atratum]